MRTALLLRRTRMHFPRLDVDHIKIRPIEKGGSDRKFYRIQCGADSAAAGLVLVKYNLEREENRHYVQIANFLDARGIRVPKIYFHDPAEGLIWIEDLGQRDLCSYQHESWLVRRAFYESALDQIVKLHSLPESVCVEMKGHLPAEFNGALYRWEQKYFFQNCLGRYFSVSESKRRELATLAGLREIAKHLASLPRVLVHRDFQSQNIIIRNGQAYLIDFQGMRPGLPQYDLASLLLDPYVPLLNEERSHLLSYYFERNSMGWNRTEFDRVYYDCGIQRLMQALGAYGVIGMLKEKREFLRHIQPAIKTLIEVASVTENFRFFADFLAGLPARPKTSI